MKATTKLKIKKFFHLPIYGVDVLRTVRENHFIYKGLCYALDRTLKSVGCRKPEITYFPLFGRNVEKFEGNRDSPYWWKSGDWSIGRLDYLDWLIEQYKDDKTDIRKL